jgi:acyl-coenzyme A thioesterase PaaI-like protein
MSHTSVIEIIQHRLGDRIGEFLLPPPVFETMHGEFVAFDAHAGILKTRFPVLHEFLNPYKAMQGGMLAAAVDNTLGPLSMLVAPPNVTRRLEMKYSRPITPDLNYISVEGKFLGQEEQRLTFSAEVRIQRQSACQGVPPIGLSKLKLICTEA